MVSAAVVQTHTPKQHDKGRSFDDLLSSPNFQFTNLSRLKGFTLSLVPKVSDEEEVSMN